jgi:hypothetical protein
VKGRLFDAGNKKCLHGFTNTRMLKINGSTVAWERRRKSEGKEGSSFPTGTLPSHVRDSRYVGACASLDPPLPFGPKSAKCVTSCIGNVVIVVVITSVPLLGQCLHLGSYGSDVSIECLHLLVVLIDFLLELLGAAHVAILTGATATATTTVTAFVAGTLIDAQTIAFVIDLFLVGVGNRAP